MATCNNSVNGTHLPAAETEWQMLDRRLTEIADASFPNWDGYGADPANPKLFEIARNILRELSNVAGARSPYMYLTRIGGVQFEWILPEFNLEIEVEVELDGSLRALTDHQGVFKTFNLPACVNQWPPELMEPISSTKNSPAVV